MILSVPHLTGNEDINASLVNATQAPYKMEYTCNASETSMKQCEEYYIKRMRKVCIIGEVSQST